MSKKEYNDDEIRALLDALKEGEIEDVGIKSPVGIGSMKQNDIDKLVMIIQELQRYHEIGTPEECEEYKKKALGL